METKRKLVSILVPCYNEEQSLPLFYEEVTKVTQSIPQYDFEIFFVNDGSFDGTLSIIDNLYEQDKTVSYVSLSRNFGKENAMLAGFDYLRGDCVIIMDADLQDPPKLVPQMLEYWEQGFQDVYAKRADRGSESWLRKQFSLLFYKILARSTRFEMLQNVGDFRLLDRKCVDALTKMRETERYTKGMFCWIGYKKKEIVFNRNNRVAGTSNWSFHSLFNLAIEGITSFTTAPLRFASIMGFMIALVAFIYLIYFLTKTLLFGDPVRGFPTLVIVILFLGGVQLLCMGILGEYIGRIFNETKKRPPYLVEEYKKAQELDEQE